MEVRAEGVVDAVDILELYDFRSSGVFAVDEGVMLFLGSKDGDAGVALWESARGGDVRIVDKRFRRLASVGLMVRAPSPEACGMVDMRRLDPGPGIADL